MKKTYFFFTLIDGKRSFKTVEHDSDEAAIEAAKQDPTVYEVLTADGSRKIYQNEQ